MRGFFHFFVETGDDGSPASRRPCLYLSLGFLISPNERASKTSAINCDKAFDDMHLDAA
jgi:hypothetical protein